MSNSFQNILKSFTTSSKKLVSQLEELQDEVSYLRTELKRDEETFLSIADQKTPGANATVKRMAKIADERLNEMSSAQ